MNNTNPAVYMRPYQQLRWNSSIIKFTKLNINNNIKILHENSLNAYKEQQNNKHLSI